MKQAFPFSALVGQDLMKRALLLNVVDPGVGGVLIRGERGTAKSTGVRALAGLLPAITVIEGCPFRCDPGDPAHLCPSCAARLAAGGPLPSALRPVRLVDLPIGATEDRLLGSINIERALKCGERAFEPGLLAEAHRGILYVDEVNLLCDQIVDLLLDAAASGVNVVEREGMSFSHASRFILVGTMNPEEGDLRPQLLDRFGLSVTIEGIRDVSSRVEIVKRRMAFDENPEAFRARFAAEDAALLARLSAAREVLPEVALTEAHLVAASRIAVALETDGHRADIVMARAARANAALEGRICVTPEDLQVAARLALSHRGKKAPLEKARLDPEKIEETVEEAVRAAADAGEWAPARQNAPRTPPPPVKAASPLACATHLAPAIHDLRVAIPWHRIVPGAHPGRRFPVPSHNAHGAVRGSRLPAPSEARSDVSIIGTVRAAAPFQAIRERFGRLAITPDDLRLRKRSRTSGLTLLMLLDSSASMHANDRMAATKGVISTLLEDLYLRRDKLGIVTFRHTAAEVLLPLTRNVREAADALERLPVGGRTPLAAGLATSLRLLLQETRKNPEALPVLALFSDGRPNVSSFGEHPLDETFHFAREFKRRHIQTLFIDLEQDPMCMGAGFEIAQRMDATYLPLRKLLR